MSKENLIKVIEQLGHKIRKENLRELTNLVNKTQNTDIYHHRGVRNLLVIKVDTCHKVLEIV